ncbi:MAG: hypothetical protein IKR49_08870 [Clostridia bacterium]|nr:hypothetical protein [Clostridia bacterium]
MADSLEEQTQRALQQLREMQHNMQSTEPADAAPERKPSAPLPQPGAQSLLRFLRLDSDALLILPLILLLSREGADNALLLALVYILL